MWGTHCLNSLPMGPKFLSGDRVSEDSAWEDHPQGEPTNCECEQRKTGCRGDVWGGLHPYFLRFLLHM